MGMEPGKEGEVDRGDVKPACYQATRRLLKLLETMNPIHNSLPLSSPTLLLHGKRPSKHDEHDLNDIQHVVQLSSCTSAHDGTRHFEAQHLCDRASCAHASSWQAKQQSLYPLPPGNAYCRS